MLDGIRLETRKPYNPDSGTYLISLNYAQASRFHPPASCSLMAVDSDGTHKRLRSSCPGRAYWAIDLKPQPMGIHFRIESLASPRMVYDCEFWIPAMARR